MSDVLPIPAAPRSGYILCLCCRCGLVYGIKDTTGPDGISHGYCVACAVIVRAEMERELTDQVAVTE